MATKNDTYIFETFIIEGAEYKTLLSDKFKNRKKYEEKDSKIITAFIPGTILKLFIKKGSKIAEGEPLLILEAMKMRNIVKSPLEGRVRSIYVSENEKVAKEQLLVEME